MGIYSLSPAKNDEYYNGLPLSDLPHVDPNVFIPPRGAHTYQKEQQAIEVVVKSRSKKKK